MNQRAEGAHRDERAKKNGQSRETRQAQSGQQVRGHRRRGENIYENMMRWIADADLEEGSKELLKNMLSKELVLGCFDDAEMNDWRWKIRRKRDMFFAMHPDHRFILDAEDQQAIYDDPHATLTQLSDQQRQIVRDFFDVLEARITRAKQGFQQEMMNMDIHEERGGETEPEEQKGGLRGWLGL